MYKRHISPLFAVAVALVLVLTLLTVVQQQAAARQVAQQASCQTFTETGKAVCGRFFAYWKEHGGLMQQGYPISGELNDVSEVDGRTYLKQYFERGVFEYHPENTLSNDVLLSLLGSTFYKQRYSGDAPGQHANNGSVRIESAKSPSSRFERLNYR